MEQLATEVHKPTYKPKAYRKVLTYYPNDIWSADIVDMQEVHEQNNGYKYILTVIDIYSRYAWAIPLKNKTGKLTSEALKSIVNATGSLPNALWVDQGKEFYNKDVKTVMKHARIYSTHGDSKAAIIERFNKTLKNEMYRQFTMKQNRKWVDMLDSLLSKYNNRTHRSIGAKPKLVYERKVTLPTDTEVIPLSKPKFKVGDRVRISYKRRPVFDKAYYPNWTYEIFTVTEVIQSDPWTYKLKDYQDNIIDGSFYESELQKTKQKKDVYLIEKILKKKKVKGKEFALVKWLGYPETASTWQPVENLGEFKMMD